MATKAKTPPPAAPAENTLSSRLGEAIALVQAGKPKAAEALDAVMAEASAQGQVALARTARHYRAALDRRKEDAKASSTTPLSEALLLLNRRRFEEALAQLDSPAAAKGGSQAHRHYLRSAALVQLQRLDEGAEAMRKAVDLDASLRFQYRLEPDFNPARRHAGFADFELN